MLILIGRTTTLVSDRTTKGSPTKFSVERYTLAPAADRNSFVQTEEVRLAAPGSPWQQTRRWTWTRRP